MTLLDQARATLPALRRVLTLPRQQQLAALDALRRSLPPLPADEAWNSAFGPGSLFAGWTASPFTQAIYAANMATLAELAPGWTIVEVGGGDGSLWARLPADARGELYVVDPHPEPAEQVRARVPPGVTVHAILGRVPEVELPAADAIVCSLTLHHVAGADAAERAQHGLSGPGKLEALQAFAAALRPRRGVLLLNEADIHCDLAIASGDPLLAERLADSYVRRCAMGLADAIESNDDADLAARWWVIVRRWCLDQLDQAGVPVADRDVYELDVPRWLALLDRAGFDVGERGFTDDWGLFYRYVATPR